MCGPWVTAPHVGVSSCAHAGYCLTAPPCTHGPSARTYNVTTLHPSRTNLQPAGSCAGPHALAVLALPPSAHPAAPPPTPSSALAPHSAPNPHRALVQKLALAYWSFHYAKRIVETFTIHK